MGLAKAFWVFEAVVKKNRFLGRSKQNNIIVMASP